nr:MAG TPA: hypothetical protein [Crassvirales sp.]
MTTSFPKLCLIQQKLRLILCLFLQIVFHYLCQRLLFL